MAERIVYQADGEGYALIVTQKGPDNFAVQYGQNVEGGLSYIDAAHRFGECLFHRLACEDKLDNTSKGETQTIFS